MATATCFYHPDRETQVSCGRCGRPLCPDCVRHGATGVRCEECIRPSPRERGVASGEQIARACVAALAAGTVGGLVLGRLPWVNVLSALLLGFGVGSAAFLASGRRRNVAIQGIGGGMAFAGILLAVVVSSLSGAPGGSGGIARVLVNISYWQFLVPALASIAGAILRFLV